jgi:hypothetical protein
MDHRSENTNVNQSDEYLSKDRHDVFETTIDRALRSTEKIRNGFLHIRDLISRLESLQTELQDHAMLLVGGFERVITTISDRQPMGSITAAVTDCGPLCRQVETIMEEIKQIKQNIDPLHKECQDCFEFIKKSDLMKESIEEWMVYIEKSVRRIKFDSRHSLDLVTYIQESPLTGVSSFDEPPDV